MLHSRGELLLMLDADGATKVTDLAKLEAEVCRTLNLMPCCWAGFNYDEHNISTFAFLPLGSCVGRESWVQCSTLC